MDAAELARWTRFAAKGGIGKCTATRDCIAESSEDLMFLKDDEIIVLMQLSDQQNIFLGYCEGVVGRFQRSDVQFLTRLKKPVMTKRSSLSSSSQQGHLLAKSPTPTVDFSKTPSPKSLPGSPIPSRRRTLTGSSRRVSTDSQMSQTIMGASILEKEKEKQTELEQQKLGASTSVGDVHSSPLSSSVPTTSAVMSSSSTWSGVALVSEPEPVNIHQPDQKPTLYSSIPPPLPAQVHASVLRQTSPPSDSRSSLPHTSTTLRSSTSTGIGSTVLTTSAAYQPPSPPPPLTSPSSSTSTTATIVPHAGDTSASTFDTTFDTTRISLSLSDSDGAVGIGLSLLQDLANGGGYSDDDADSDEASGSRPLGRNTSVRVSDSGSEEMAQSPSWMRSRTPSPSPSEESLSRYSGEGDSMRTEGPNRVEGLQEDDHPQYEDDDTEQGHGGELEHEDDRGVDQEYSDDEYEEDEETTEGFDLILSSSPSTFSSVSTPPKSHLHHRPSPLHTMSSSSSPPPLNTSQQLTFPPVAPLSPQRYRSFRQQQLQFNFPAPPTHTPVPVPVPSPVSNPTRTSTSTHASISMRSSSSSASSSPRSANFPSPRSPNFPSPRSPNFPSHLPPPGIASHPTSPLPASFPFPGPSSDDGDGREMDRERRPSLASHFSNTTGTAGSDWDGAGDIYDDYRYSRSSIAGTVRTMSAASVSVANTHGRNGSGSVTGSRRVSAGSRRTSVGSRRTSAGSSSAKRASVSAAAVRMNGGEMDMLPPPFVDNPEARMRADSELQQARSRSRSNTNNSISVRPEPVPLPAPALAAMDVNPRGIPSSNGDLDEDFAGRGQSHAKHIRDGQKTLPRYQMMDEGSTSDDADDDASIYTQSSVGRGSMASVSRARHTNVPSISTPVSTPNPAPTSTSAPSASSRTTSSRPAPLPLGLPDGQTTTGPSPLLHTTWGSPVSSNPTATPATGYMDGRAAGGFTPLIGGALDALSRALAVAGSKASVDAEKGGGGPPNMLHQRIEVQAKPTPPPLVLTSDVNANRESRSRENGLGNGRGIVVEDEDELVISPSSPASSRTASEVLGGMFGMARYDSPEPEPEMARVAPLVVAHRTPERAGPGVGDGAMEVERQVAGREKERTEKLSSPVVPSVLHTEPPQVLLMPSTNAANLSPNSAFKPPLSSSPSSPPPSSASPSHLRPSLLDLRGGQPGPGQGQRRSLFLPHPNAPKPPSAHSPGPMYIAQQQPPPQQHQARSGVVQTIRLALGGHGVPGRRPTIYGRTQVDLAASIGPVLMTFSVDPPPATAPPPSSTSSPPVNVMPGSALSPSSPPPNSQGHHVALSVQAGSIGAGSPEPTLVDQRGSGVIPRANFFPKAGGVRPRSRSFSGFNSQSSEVPLPVQRSREEGSPTLEMPSVIEVRRSLSPGPLSPTLSPSPTKTSSLRISSPLAMSQHNNVGSGALPLPKSPGSLLAQTTTPTSSPSSSPNIRLVHQLRRNISKADLNEPPPSKPYPMSRTTLSSVNIGTESVPISPVFPPSQGRDSTPDTTSTRGHPSVDTDTASLHSTRSNVISPPLVVRDPSLRTKLSLPNLRRNRSRQDDTSSIGSVSQPPESDTVQVKDMDFELVRPNLSHLQPNRSSEDSSLLGRDVLADFKYPSSLRTDSPAVSTSSPRSPIVSDGSSPSARQPVMLPNVQSKSSESESSMDAHRQRELKWMSVLSAVPPSQAKKSKKVKKLLLDGVPSSVRYLVWTHLTDGKARCVPGVYAQLGARGRVPAFVDIERDVQRCFNDHPHLQSMHGSILSLLQAYLTMVPDVQYTTGLTLIAGQLLLLAPEEDAFWIFVSIMDTHIRPYFSSSPQIDVDSALFSRALENIDPVLAKKILMDMSISPNSICRPWFTSLFVGSLPSEHLNRVWDIFLLEGVPFLIRVGLAVVSACRRQILDATSEAAVLRHLSHPHLSLLPPTADAFISLAFSVKLKDDDIRKQRVKMEAQVKRQTQTPRLVSTSATISLPRN